MENPATPKALEGVSYLYRSTCALEYHHPRPSEDRLREGMSQMFTQLFQGSGLFAAR